MKNSNIEWCDHTCNFWHGCFKVSQGCSNCYALDISKRFGKKSIWGPPQHSPRELKKGIWKELPKWNQQAQEAGVRKRVFVQSMADFFEDHQQVGEWRNRATAMMRIYDCLDYQVLTKRPENILSMVPQNWLVNWPAHVWAGTSVENQETADKRVVDLLPVPAAVRFLSCEPLLGPVLLDNGYSSWLTCNDPRPEYPDYDIEDDCCESYMVGGNHFHGIDWVITGGESGSQSRPFDLQWARDIVRQCQAAGVPVFVKQMGSNPVDNGRPVRFKDKKGGDISEWPEDLRVREMPEAAITRVEEVVHISS